jgi:uncharacterized protein (TIGR03435 family)
VDGLGKTQRGRQAPGRRSARADPADDPGAVGAPVLDRTGLEGKYTFMLEFAPLLGTPKENETLPTVFAALQEKLGLKLEATKGPVEILVIDRAEKPTEN